MALRREVRHPRMVVNLIQQPIIQFSLVQFSLVQSRLVQSLFILNSFIKFGQIAIVVHLTSSLFCPLQVFNLRIMSMVAMYIISWLPHIYYYEYVSAPYEDFGHRRDNIIIIIIIFRGRKAPNKHPKWGVLAPE